MIVMFMVIIFVVNFFFYGFVYNVKKRKGVIWNKSDYVYVVYFKIFNVYIIRMSVEGRIL